MKANARLALAFSGLILTACVHAPPRDPHSLMHSHFFQSSGMARQMAGDPERNDHAPKSARLGQLKGLRIALDPGHIGGDPWDERNGKYIFNKSGARLSEGLLALQLSMLLEKELKALGAVVYIDRGFAPVTAHEFDDFGDLKHVFFQRLDLDARAERLWAFRPDLTLILHFDAHHSNLDESKELCHDTKAYTPGAFEADDMADEVEHAFVQIAWRNPVVWDESLALSRSLVGQIHAKMGIPLAVETPNGAQLVEPGVLARSLRLQRHMAGFVSSYVETMCYEDPAELAALGKADHKMTIDGKSYGYSSRLVQLAEALRDGVVNYSQLHTKIPQ